MKDPTFSAAAGSGAALARRPFLLGLGGVALSRGPAAAAAQGPGPFPIRYPTARTARPMKIGIVGAGRVGTMLGELWLRAGHQVMFSGRGPASSVKDVTDRLPGSLAGTSAQAAAFGDVVMLSVPYAAMPDIARDLGPSLRGKVVLDVANPLRGDGEIGRAALAKGTGLATAEYFPGALIVRGFNSVPVPDMGLESNRPGEKAGIMLAADDPRAMAMGERLVRDAGFDPVPVGPLAAASRFEHSSPAFGVRTAAEIRRILGLKP